MQQILFSEYVCTIFGSNHVICLITQADYKSRCSDWLHKTASLLQISVIKGWIVLSCCFNSKVAALKLMGSHWISTKIRCLVNSSDGKLSAVCIWHCTVWIFFFHRCSPKARENVLGWLCRGHCLRCRLKKGAM